MVLEVVFGECLYEVVGGGVGFFVLVYDYVEGGEFGVFFVCCEMYVCDFGEVLYWSCGVVFGGGVGGYVV